MRGKGLHETGSRSSQSNPIRGGYDSNVDAISVPPTRRISSAPAGLPSSFTCIAVLVFDFIEKNGAFVRNFGQAFLLVTAPAEGSLHITNNRFPAYR